MYITKFLKISALLICVNAPLFAQNSAANPSPFIFPQFVKGVVLQKNGASVAASLNYNTFTQEMMFDNGGAKMVLDQAANIDTIYLQNRAFIPARQVYFEKLASFPVSFYVQYKNKAVFGNNNTNQSNVVVSDNYKKKEVQPVDPYALQLPDNYRLVSDNKYWVQKELEFIPAANNKKFLELFPGKEAQIRDFIKANEINFSSREDIFKLIEFCKK